MATKCRDSYHALKGMAAQEGRHCEVWSAREEMREEGRKQARTPTRAIFKRRLHLLAEPSVAHVEDGLGDIKASDAWNYAESLANLVGCFVGT